MNDAATSAARAPIPAAWSKWHPQRDPLRSAFDTLLRPIRACRAAHGDPRRRHEQALRAGRRSPPRDSHMADLPDDSTSACMGSQAFRSSLEITVGLHLSMRYHGTRTWLAAHRRRQAFGPRFLGSEDLPVSFPLTMQVTMYVASSGSVPSDRRGRREITYPRSGERWATLNPLGWVECLTGSKSRHQVARSQGAAKHSSQT